MRYLFVAAFILLLDVSASQDVMDFPCKTTQDCLSLSNVPPEVICYAGFCKCNDDRGIPQKCPPLNVTVSAPTNTQQSERTTAAALIGRPCSLEKDCSGDTNAFCNTTRKQCACKKDFFASMDNQRCLQTIRYNNSGCEINDQCLNSAANSTCFNGSCVCKLNYHYVSNACWEKKEFGSNCSVTPECNHVEEAICDNLQYRCMCPVDRVINPTTTFCLSIASHIEDLCVESIQCTQLLGKGGHCIDHRCRCREHHHHSTDTNKCMPNLDIGSECRTDKECLNGENGTAMKCLANRCACAEGFKNLEGKCQLVVQSKDNSAAGRFADVRSFVITLTSFILLSSVL